MYKEAGTETFCMASTPSGPGAALALSLQHAFSMSVGLNSRLTNLLGPSEEFLKKYCSGLSTCVCMFCHEHARLQLVCACTDLYGKKFGGQLLYYELKFEIL